MVRSDFLLDPSWLMNYHVFPLKDRRLAFLDHAHHVIAWFALEDM